MQYPSQGPGVPCQVLPGLPGERKGILRQYEQQVSSLQETWDYGRHPSLAEHCSDVCPCIAVVETQGIHQNFGGSSKIAKLPIGDREELTAFACLLPILRLGSSI